MPVPMAVAKTFLNDIVVCPCRLALRRCLRLVFNLQLCGRFDQKLHVIYQEEPRTAVRKFGLCVGTGALTSSTLASLDLGGNDLGAVSLLPICAAYKAASAQCRLETLELFGNNHDEDGEFTLILTFMRIHTIVTTRSGGALVAVLC